MVAKESRLHVERLPNGRRKLTKPLTRVIGRRKITVPQDFETDFRGMSRRLLM